MSTNHTQPQTALRDAIGATDTEAETGLVGGGQDPIIVDSVQLLLCEAFWVLIMRSADGSAGISIARPLRQDVATLVDSMGRELVIGSDARDVRQILQRIRARVGLKASFALNARLAWLEMALLDLVGRSRNCAVASLLGDVRRSRIPLYLSSHGRRFSPEVELESIALQLETTGIRAVKLKVGLGRQRGDDAEDAPRRAERLIPLARKQLGDDVTLYVDANGTYTIDRAIEVARVLSDNGVAWFEEPCPGGNHHALTQVARRSDVPIALGEKAFHQSDFQHLLDTGVCAEAQPDLWRIGGLLEARAVSRVAIGHGVPTTLHHSRGTTGCLYLLHFAASISDPGPYQEYRSGLESTAGWFDPPLEILNGELELPSGGGFGLELDARRLAQKVKAITLRSSLARFKGRVFSFLGR